MRSHNYWKKLENFGHSDKFSLSQLVCTHFLTKLAPLYTYRHHCDPKPKQLYLELHPYDLFNNCMSTIISCGLYIFKLIKIVSVLDHSDDYMYRGGQV